MSAIGLLILQIMMMVLRSANGQFGSGGGPSTFGYDGSSACSKPYSRNGRARFEKLPCDFRRQNWCTVAGSSYPWHAVRRFVQENQGLMRRMYGDERHINILKAELEKNDIELEYDDRYQRYPDDARRFQYDDEYEFVNTEKKKRTKFHDESLNDEARSYNDETLNEQLPITERTRKYTKTSIEYTRTNTRSSDSTTVPNSSSSEFTDESRDSSISSTTIVNNFHDNLSSLKTSTLSISLDSSTERILPTEEKNKNFSSSMMEKVASTVVSAVTLADIARIKNSSINEIPGKLEMLKNHGDLDSTELPIINESTKNIENTTLEPESTSQSSSSLLLSSSSTSPDIIDRIDETLIDDEDFKNTSPVDQIFAAAEQETQQQFRPRPEYRPTETKPETSNMEGQLFQDVAAKDQQEQPVLKLRGVNACPVKEEVVAPFWANNTRGEVLALLNLYPFEQYVHWEKCTHENKQMYCRDGCRCEQQYRLHRLLAYDPNNECRGIFSDWFKFPSCCVCRCYDLPVEFRVTSRSPRIQKQKLRLRPPGHGR